MCKISSKFDRSSDPFPKIALVSFNLFFYFSFLVSFFFFFLIEVVRHFQHATGFSQSSRGFTHGHELLVPLKNPLKFKYSGV